ncbi:MAG TPA: hypothetical protein EYN72_06520 [Dehalococcoidia bacterium]|nr:hypothetical protein [Dehalococcoidia bacterium]
MGESIIIAPIKRWLQRNLLPGRRPKETGQDDQIAYIRDIFDLTNDPVEINLASIEAPDGVLNQLDSDLVESVFEATVPSSRKTVNVERDEYDESLPVTRPIMKVSADAAPDGQNVGARQRQQPVARSTSTEVTQDSTREALDDGAGAETDDDVEPEEELSNLVDQTLVSKAPVTDDALDFLTGDLKSIFKSKVSANPHTRRLIEKHGTVDAHDLVNDLRGLLRSIEEVERR